MADGRLEKKGVAIIYARDCSPLNCGNSVWLVTIYRWDIDTNMFKKKLSTLQISLCRALFFSLDISALDITNFIYRISFCKNLIWRVRFMVGGRCIWTSKLFYIPEGSSEQLCFTVWLNKRKTMKLEGSSAKCL